MVHALREAQRVLEPNGLLIDIRPAAAHRRVGMVRNGRWRAVGAMRETFEDDRAADRAVASVMEEGLFQLVKRFHFDLARQMDTLEDFRAWIGEFVNLESHDWLIEKLARALKKRKGKVKISVEGPLVMQVLRKIE